MTLCSNLSRHFVQPNGVHNLKCAWLETPLGSMLAIANQEALYFLEFIEPSDQKIDALICPGFTAPLRSIEKELNQYFNGKLTAFRTPLFFHGTPFQRKVWEELLKIPFGKTCSYLEIARAIGQPTAYRAVGMANNANRLAIVIPCHRVIGADGALSGYGGGVTRKKWLIDHEKAQK